MQPTMLIILGVAGFLGYQLWRWVEVARLGLGSAAPGSPSRAEYEAMVTTLHSLELDVQLGRLEPSQYEAMAAELREGIGRADERLRAYRERVLAELEARLAGGGQGAGRDSVGEAAADGAATRSCPSCGRACRVTDRFCQGCGVKLEATCPACDAVLPEGARFCKRCGHRVA